VFFSGGDSADGLAYRNDYKFRRVAGPSFAWAGPWTSAIITSSSKPSRGAKHDLRSSQPIDL